MDVMLARFDLKDAKGRSEAVRAVAPVLLDLSDAVQRDFYVQFLSRRLQTNARAVAELLAEVGRQTPRSERRRSALVPGKGAPPLADDADGPPSPDLWGMEDGASIEPQRRPARMQPPQRGVDLEVHLVALIWRKPDLVRDANVALTRAELDTLVEADFANPVLRMAFRQISRMVMGQSSQSSDEDDEWLSIIAEHDMLPRIVDDEVLLREECVRTALSLRERNLKREKAGVAAAIDAVIDAATNNQNSDGMARYNIELIMEFGRVLQHELRVQKALQLRSGIHAT